MIVVPQDTINHYVSQGWWGSESIGALFIRTAEELTSTFAVADPPNLLSLINIAPRKWSWSELLDQVGKYTQFFKDQGLQPDDIIVVQLPNTVDLHAIYLACAIYGIIISPVPMQYRLHEIEHVLDITQAHFAITLNQLSHNTPVDEWLAVAEKKPSLTQIWCFGLPAEKVTTKIKNLEKQLAKSSALTPHQLKETLKQATVTANSVFTICWTSGTEAKPKGVPRSHNEWLIVGSSVIDAGMLAKGDQLLIPYPFVNMAGISTSLIAWLMIGGGLYHHHPFDIPVFIEQLRSEPINYAVSAPAVLTKLLNDSDQISDIDFSKIKRIGSGGGPISEWLVNQYYERFGIEIVNYYGSNEGAALASTPQDMPDRALRALFFPRYGAPNTNWSIANSRKVNTRLVDLETDQEITEPHRVGELRFKGPTIFSGYFNSPELSKAAFDKDGYYCTGDLFEIAGEAQQYFRFVGRSKDIVVRGGMNISSEELEGVILSHPAVNEAAVIGWPDDILGERICAVVVAKPNMTVTLESITNYLRNVERIATFKLPEKLILVDALPRNLLGKILKRELRQQFILDNEVTL